MIPIAWNKRAFLKINAFLTLTFQGIIVNIIANTD
jgi:hypothetical protein